MRAIAIAGIVAFCAVGALAQDRAGEVTKAQPDAFQATSSIGHEVAAQDPVFTNARVYTRDYGSMDIRFDDGTELLVAPKASITIDSYVYAGGDGGSLAMTLTKGAIRVISGRLRKDGYNVRTPVAAIGVRGTRYWLDADDPNKLELWVDEGEIVARPNQSDQEFVFAAPLYATCSPTACALGEAPPKPVTFPLDPRAMARDRDSGGGGR